MINKLGQEPSFPVTNIHVLQEKYNGMNKRFYAACIAMQGLLANDRLIVLITKKAKSNGMYWMDNVVEHAYGLADELLKQEDSK